MVIYVDMYLFAASADSQLHTNIAVGVSGAGISLVSCCGPDTGHNNVEKFIVQFYNKYNKLRHKVSQQKLLLIVRPQQLRSGEVSLYDRRQHGSCVNGSGCCCCLCRLRH